ncbi:cellulose synthase subunit BcsC-related outer membrane protein [Silvibacterium acidisoli]|uniref:cellulose synthase subunit BcsC-related outer membrane protein n=1 Tax=Acidobacteriaceae bacterium ZG23-2 TaxID=2883246 RepID=UPI00406D3FF0
MEKTITTRLRKLGLTAALAAMMATFVSPGHAQSAVSILLERARTQEQAGHIDLAAQSWQQVLLSDPKNTEALAGLARAAKMSGNQAEANKYLARLRQVNPADPNLSLVQSMQSTSAQNAQLQQAAHLAQQGQAEEALKIYRQVWGSHPPDGNWALAYYDTEAGTDSGRADAVNGLRGLVKKYPNDSRYAITLGRILTYRAQTRDEGETILREHTQEPAAQAALRQSLVWDSQNPRAAEQIRDYLRQHKDAELQQSFEEAQTRQAHTPAPSGMGGPEQAAYSALSAGRVDEAQSRFLAIEEKNPDNPRALAGMGFVRMKQGNFADAIGYLEQAQQHGANDKAVSDALNTSHFWFSVQQGTTALNDNRLDEAANKYQSALQMRPDAPEALEGLAGTYLKANRPNDAANVYLRITQVQPKFAGGWRGLFASQVRAGDSAAAIATSQRFPAVVRDEVANDPEYLGDLASAYTATGQDAEAQQVLARALTLPFPDNGRNMKAATRLQYAGLLAQDKRYAQAAGLYRDIIEDDPDNASAWQGLVSVQHEAGHDAEAVETVERIPPATYEITLQDAGFLALLASIYQQQNHDDVALGFLQRAAKAQADAGQTVAVPLQLQLAAIYLQQNNPQQAYTIYRNVLTQNPGRIDAWKGLFSALHQTGHDQDALAQLQQVPPDARRSLDADVQFQQTIAAVYAATGNQAAATQMLQRIQAHYRSTGGVIPGDIAIQNAWLLFNTKDDRGLYRALMALGGRTDLTDDQRRTVQSIWTSWSVQRAGQAVDAGRTSRALEILNTASQAFPDNPGVSKTLAPAYVKAGDAKRAMAIYNSLDMTNASAADYQGMIGAALAVPNLRQAEAWLRQALDAYPHDPSILSLAARFEQARGDNPRAAAYWQASINAMPNETPANKLAHTLDKPDLETRPAQQRTLAGLLNPDANDGMGTVAARPALPGYESASAAGGSGLYGPDPYSVGHAPVTFNGEGSAQSGNTQTTTTTTTTTTYAPPAQKTARPASAPALRPVTPRPVAPKPVTTPAPVVHHHRPASTGTSSHTYTTTHTTTTTTGTSGSSYGNSSERLGDYVPQSNAVPTSSLEAPKVTASPSQPENAFAAPEPPPADRSLRGGSGITASGSEGPKMLDDAQLHLTISSGQIAPSGDVLEELRKRQKNAPSPAAESSPVELTLEQSPAIGYVPSGSASVEAYNRASTALATAEQPVNAAFVTPQTAPAAQQVESQPYRQMHLTQMPQQQLYAQTEPLPTVPPAQSQIAPPPPGWRKVKQTTVTTTTTTVNNNAQQQQQGASDQQLQQEDLPPLRGPYGPKRPPHMRNPREEAEMQLATIDGGYSPWMGGTGYVNHRSGTAGFDQLTALEAPFEASAIVGNAARLTLVVSPSFLDSGVADGTSTNRLGTAAVGATPAQQSLAGVGGEVQLTTANFGIAAGYTPYGFLVSNATGRFNWRPAAGPLTFRFSREPIKDSQLSYGGMRDPGSVGPGYDGNIWGGVMTNAGNVQFGKGDSQSGYYFGMGGQYITGHHVESNSRIDGVAGAYWRVLTVPDTGDLTIGTNFFGMHYTHNLRYFTYGQGGYFSPQAYMLANVPVTWNGRYGVNFHYTVAGAFGLQAFQEDTSPFFPLDPALQVANSNPSYAGQTVVGSNYDLHAEGAYHLTDHWYAGAYVSFNNTRDYANQTVGFFVRFLIRPQYQTEQGPTGLFPMQGNRPIMVP